LPIKVRSNRISHFVAHAVGMPTHDTTTVDLLYRVCLDAFARTWQQQVKLLRRESCLLLGSDCGCSTLLLQYMFGEGRGIHPFFGRM